MLEMLHTIMIKFPKAIVDEQSQTIFVHLVVCLANDQDNKVRSMTGAVIKLLIGCISQHSLNSILEYSLSWYLGEKQQLWSAGAQVLFSKSVCQIFVSECCYVLGVSELNKMREMF